MSYTLKWKAEVLFSWGINFFSDKINLERASEPLMFPRYTRNIDAKTHFFPKILFTYCVQISKHTDDISKRASQQAGVRLFS